jgi:hypothetical protein
MSNNNFENIIRPIEDDISSINMNISNIKRDITVLQGRLPTPVRRAAAPVAGDATHVRRRMMGRSAKSPSRKKRRIKRKKRKGTKRKARKTRRTKK